MKRVKRKKYVIKKYWSKCTERWVWRAYREYLGFIDIDTNIISTTSDKVCLEKLGDYLHHKINGHCKNERVGIVFAEPFKPEDDGGLPKWVKDELEERGHSEKCQVINNPEHVPETGTSSDSKEPSVTSSASQQQQQKCSSFKPVL